MADIPADPAPKLIRWMGPSLNDLKKFSRDVKRSVGVALRAAQEEGMAPYAKPLKGFGGASVLEIADDFDGETYRAVYTVRVAGFMLHAFQKKSKSGIATPKNEIVRIKKRLKRAKELYASWQKSAKRKSK